MSFTAKLFSFEGRIGRGDWWLINLLLMVVLVGGTLLALRLTGFPPEAIAKNGKPTSVEPGAFDIGGVLLALLGPWLLTLWPQLAVQVKRWHDRDKSAAWIAVNFIPWIGSIWALIELGFLPGTPGVNHYGSGPGLSARALAAFDEEHGPEVAGGSNKAPGLPSPNRPSTRRRPPRAASAAAAWRRRANRVFSGGRVGGRA